MRKKDGPPLTPQEIEWCRRFARLRQRVGATGEEFAKGIPGLYKSNVSGIENQVRRPTAAMMKALADKYRAHTTLGEIMADDWSDAGMHAKSKSRLLPVLNEVQAGDYLMSTDLDYPPGFSEIYAPSLSENPNAFFLVIRGESMTGGDIRPGDYVLVEPGLPVENGNIVVAIGPNGCSIKKFHKNDNMIVLSPMNPEFAPLSVGKKESEEFRFYRVTQLQRRL
ncbi:MAG: hypothetical protein IH577_04535 [Deltaproteobacteria bacterium]|nr:hypothetical protein [Deltaproteobacteria bacterium]